MKNKSDTLLAALYNKWKSGVRKDFVSHPGEEELACLFENKAGPKEAASLTEHLIACRRCGEILAMELKTYAPKQKRVPAVSLRSVKDIVQPRQRAALYVLLQWKQEVLTLLETTGDVILGRQRLPPAVFRSRPTPDVSGGIVVLKEIVDTRVEIKIERAQAPELDVTISVKKKSGGKPLDNARVTLIRDDIVLESYTSATGTAVFRQVAPGKYTIAIAKKEMPYIEIVLEIRV